MELLLKRIARKETYTIGKLYVNGKYVCDTCEDADRLYFGKPKVKGVTAIPRGKYEVVQNVFSPRFGSKTFYKTRGIHFFHAVNICAVSINSDFQILKFHNDLFYHDLVRI